MALARSALYDVDILDAAAQQSSWKMVKTCHVTIPHALKGGHSAAVSLSVVSIHLLPAHFIVPLHIVSAEIESHQPRYLSLRFM